MISSLSRRLLPRTATAAARRRSLPAGPARPVPSRAFGGDDKGKRTTLTRDALADILAAEHKLSTAESKRVLATVFDSIVEAVASKEAVALPGFGKFAPREVAARSYRNPQDPAAPPVPKPATTRVKFTPFSHFKDCVAAGRAEKPGTD